MNSDHICSGRLCRHSQARQEQFSCKTGLPNKAIRASYDFDSWKYFSLLQERQYLTFNLLEFFFFLSFLMESEIKLGNGTPLRYSCLENPMDGGAWWAAVHGVAKSQTQLSDFTFTFHFHALEEEMAIHSSVLAWRLPGTGEPGGLPSMGSHRVGHDWSDLAAAAASHQQEKGIPIYLR